MEEDSSGALYWLSLKHCELRVLSALGGGGGGGMEGLRDVSPKGSQGRLCCVRLQPRGKLSLGMEGSM